MQSLSDFYHTQYPCTPFSTAFLDGLHLLQLRDQLTTALRFTTGNPYAEQVPFSEMLVARLIYFTQQFQLTEPHPEAMRKADEMFIGEFIDNMTWDANYKSFWQRWCSEGIPDPNNMPLPIYGDKRDMTIETSDYMLSHPFGTERLPRY